MIQRHHNNFDFLRFVFALFVLISHSFALIGKVEEESLLKLTYGQLSFSGLGLAGFFVISGYFIYKSMERSSSIWDYLKKRCLRVFPALFVVLFLTLLIIPFIYEGPKPLSENFDYWTYFPNNLSLYGFQATVDGVFSNLPYRSINGSLWTIRYEFSLYVALVLLLLIKKKSLLKLILTSTLLFLFVVSYQMNFLNIHDRQLFDFQGVHVLNLGSYFIAGSLLAQLELNKWKHDVLIWVSLGCVLIALYLGVFSYVKHILIPILVLSIGFYPILLLQRFSNYGDPSYGIYIYSFPIQQLLVFYFSPDIITLMIFSFLLSIIFGYISWHLIEKRLLKLKSTNKMSSQYKGTLSPTNENSLKL